MYNAWAEKIQSQEMGNRLIGYGSYLPERVVKNAEFERVMDTTDEWIVPFRKLLLIEQFKNPKLEAIYRDVFINRPLSYMEAMFEILIKLGYMKPGNPKVYAMDLYSPFFMYHTIQGDNAEIIETLREHVTLFRKNVVTDEVKER